MMASTQVKITAHRENILYDACEAMAHDFMSIDPSSFASYFHRGDTPAVYEQVNNVIDKHFKRGSVTFACTGDSLTPWNEAPVVAIDLEFISNSIFAFFRMILTGKEPVVELHHITFHESTGNPETNSTELKRALHSARL